MKISVFGLGYVGAVSCGCLAKLGHEIIGVDTAQTKVDLVNRGVSPLVEPGLDQLLGDARATGRLRATTDPGEAVRASDVAMLCVGTPSTASGGIETRFLETVTTQIAETLAKSGQGFFVVLTRSTSLPPVHQKLMSMLEAGSRRRLGEGVGYACHPEFLREGSAVDDFFGPPKIVFGLSDARSQAVCEEIYPGIAAETFFVEPEVAAMVKYADNAFHAVKVTFANELGTLAKSMGVDAERVMQVFCADRKLNISEKYLKPGFAFGGSCLPKDVRALVDHSRAAALATPLLSSLLESNEKQVSRVVRALSSPERPKIGMVGLAFKEGTDDVRESPMVSLVEQLSGKGMPLKIFDRHLSLATLTGANKSFALQSIPHLAELLEQNLQELVDFADVLVVSHRLHEDDWKALRLRPSLRIFDLVRVPALAKLPRYEGIYW
jgi:GDP-mannose 6-dehydrogenase